jgi:hypothetical protein
VSNFAVQWLFLGGFKGHCRKSPQRQNKQRHPPKPHHKDSKLHKFVVDRQQACRLEKDQLPKDA